MAHLDGNALAGRVLELIAGEVTSAVGQCDGCGSVRPVAEAAMFADAPGSVLRCAACDHVLLRLVQSEDRVWIDLRGLRYVEVPQGQAGSPPP